jgi:hypothetical protein
MLLLIHGHGEEDGYVFPEWFVNARGGGLGGDGRGGYGTVRNDED